MNSIKISMLFLLYEFIFLEVNIFDLELYIKDYSNDILIFVNSLGTCVASNRKRYHVFKTKGSRFNHTEPFMIKLVSYEISFNEMHCCKNI